MFNRRLFALMFIMVCPLIGGCKQLVSGADVPTDILDSDQIKNDQGVRLLYEGVHSNMLAVYGGGTDSYVRATGLFSDELKSVQGILEPFPVGFYSIMDSRLINESAADPDTYTPIPQDDLFAIINSLRVKSLNTRAMNLKYSSSDQKAWISGRLQIYEALSMIMLGEMYCSGVPLSRLDFEQNFTLTGRFSTDEIFDKSISLLDSTLQLYTPDEETKFLASQLKARALTQRGKLAEALNALADVPVSFRYSLRYDYPYDGRTMPLHKYWIHPEGDEQLADQEGINGLPFISSGDPRMALFNPNVQQGEIVLANGIEKSLIDAEYRLVQGDATWLSTLNNLRTACNHGEPCDNPAPAGSGGVSGLALLTDPAPGISMSDTSAFRKRLLLVFQERAMWLYMNGRRHADLRRLVRNYGWLQNEVFPIGRYGAVSYGSQTNLPVPNEERQRNKNYHGCINRNA